MRAPERRAMEEEHEKLRVLVQDGDPQRYHQANEAFHATIYTGAHNDYLAELTLMTRARVRPFRRAQFRIRGRLANSHVEHDRVVQAILRGERVMAAQTMYAHIITVGEEYEHYTETL
jgi:DNA-binding GntR family transcriptional regulator